MAVPPPAPFIPPPGADVPQTLASLSQAINRKADINANPVYASVALIAPNGTVYQLTVANNGALAISTVPRP